MTQSPFSIFFFCFVFSGGCFVGQAKELWTHTPVPSRPEGVSDPGDPLRQTSLFMIVLVLSSLSNHPALESSTTG